MKLRSFGLLLSGAFLFALPLGARAGLIATESWEGFTSGSSPFSTGVWSQAGALGLHSVTQDVPAVGGSNSVRLTPQRLGLVTIAAGISRALPDQFLFPTMIQSTYFRYTDGGASTSTAGMECVGFPDSTSTYLGVFIRKDGQFTLKNSVNAITGNLSPGSLKQGWNRLDVFQDRTSFPYKAYFAVNNVLNSTPIAAPGDFYYQTRMSVWALGSTDPVYFDNFSYVSVNPDETYVQGLIELEDYSRTPDGETLGLRLDNLNDATYSESVGLRTDREGYFSLIRQRNTPSPQFNAPFAASVDGLTWLRRYSGVFNRSSYDKTWSVFPAVSLVNGDCDRDNEITILDYLILSAAFGTADGQPGFNTVADLDFDGEVTILDYLILSKNFEKRGYPSS